MSTSINSYLRDLSYKLYISSGSPEDLKIRTSVNGIKTKLSSYLGTKVNRIEVFGSYDRGTILPRSVDSKSDIDMLVTFNHTDYERNPDTYRGWLYDFGTKYYGNVYNSPVFKSHPTVGISLSHIHYDLVPCKEEGWGWTKSLYIPSNRGWQSTDPSDVKSKLESVNVQYGSIVKPIIRLLKGWNCTNGYPFESYELEKWAVTVNYSGDNIEKGLIYASKQMTTGYSDSQVKQRKINTFKKNMLAFEESLNGSSVLEAKRLIHKSIPHG